jgi:hypothetical protein
MEPEPPKHFELASQDRLTVVEPWAPRFFAEVLQMDYMDCLITDESTLWDFVADESELLAALSRFRQHYFLEPPGDGCTLIVRFLEFLQERGVAA